jgi:predicted GTPase
MAGVVVINKVDTAPEENVEEVARIIGEVNPAATVIRAESPISVDSPDLISGKRVLVIEDGPTLTHGNMSYGAGIVAARNHGAAECIDPRPFAVGEIKATLDKYSHLTDLVPAMGYGDTQIRDLEETIRASGAEAVVSGTPADLTRVINIDIPIVRVRYSLREVGTPDVESILKDFMQRRG